MTVLDRRRFLFAAGAVSAAAAADRRRIKAAVIGTAHGHAASKIRAFGELTSTFDFAGVCRPSPDEPAPPAGTQTLTAEEILADPSVELVAVETRVKRNLDFAERVIAAGKHLHLDKPPGGGFERVRALYARAAGKRVAIQMGYQWRYHPAMTLAIEAARKGWLGDVYAFEARIDKPLGAVERRELALFPGGILFDEGCHLIDRAIEVLGRPGRATGFLQHSSRQFDDGLADNTLAVLEYEHARAEIGMASFQPHGNAYRFLEISGTNGKARVEPFAPLRLLIDLKDAAGPYRAGVQTLEPAPPPGPAYAPDFLELARLIREGGEPAVYNAIHDLTVHETLLTVCQTKS